MDDIDGGGNAGAPCEREGLVPAMRMTHEAWLAKRRALATMTATAAAMAAFAVINVILSFMWTPIIVIAMMNMLFCGVNLGYLLGTGGWRGADSKALWSGYAEDAMLCAYAACTGIGDKLLLSRLARLNTDGSTAMEYIEAAIAVTPHLSSEVRPYLVVHHQLLLAAVGADLRRLRA